MKKVKILSIGWAANCFQSESENNNNSGNACHEKAWSIVDDEPVGCWRSANHIRCGEGGFVDEACLVSNLLANFDYGVTQKVLGVGQHASAGTSWIGGYPCGWKGCRSRSNSCCTFVVVIVCRGNCCSSEINTAKVGVSCSWPTRCKCLNWWKCQDVG